MYKPWLYLSLHFVIDPSQVLTYTNASNGQTYFFWISGCFNSATLAKNQAVDIYAQRLNNTCGSCLSGTYSNADTGNLCKITPPGTYAPGDANSIPLPCNASLFQYSDGAGFTECKNCTGVNAENVSYQVHSNEEGLGVSCTPTFCKVGQFFNPAIEVCENCTNNTYTINNISRSCLSCSGEGSHIVVKDGYIYHKDKLNSIILNYSKNIL